MTRQKLHTYASTNHDENELKIFLKQSSRLHNIQRYKSFLGRLRNDLLRENWGSERLVILVSYEETMCVSRANHIIY